MTYETQWKTVIDEEWEKFKSAQEAEKPGERFDGSRFLFMALFMRKKYLEETEEVQESVRKRRDELKAEIEEDRDGDEKNLAYQSN